jgi:hypothetical protein
MPNRARINLFSARLHVYAGIATSAGGPASRYQTYMKDAHTSFSHFRDKRHVLDHVVHNMNYVAEEHTSGAASCTFIQTLQMKDGIHSWGSHSGKASNLVPQTLGGDDGNLLRNLLVGLEIIGKASVVLLHQNPSRLLHGLGPHTTLRSKARLEVCP